VQPEKRAILQTRAMNNAGATGGVDATVLKQQQLDSLVYQNVLHTPDFEILKMSFPATIKQIRMP